MRAHGTESNRTGFKLYLNAGLKVKHQLEKMWILRFLLELSAIVQAYIGPLSCVSKPAVCTVTAL